MKQVKAFGTHAPSEDLVELEITRRTVGELDVEIEIMYCGVCHSDLHTARNDWGGSEYPVVPGHEIVGKVISVGSKVSKVTVGDYAAVGCMVDSCRTCPSCEQDLEQYCQNGFTGTYNGKDKHLGGRTFGGYSQSVVVDEHFVLTLPENLDLAGAAPLLCAGITTWSPLRHWNVKEGSKVAVVGLGGLGHMAIKLAKGLGADVSLFSRSLRKEEDAKQLGVDHFVLSTDEEQMQAVKHQYDVIIDTVPYEHDLNPYLHTLSVNGTLVLVGYIGNMESMMHSGRIIGGRRAVAGSLIGGIAETQEMLDFCGTHNITSDIEVIQMQEINEAYERMLKSDVKYRFVIDMQSMKG